MEQICARGKRIHARKGKIEIKWKALNEKCTAGGKGYKGFTIWTIDKKRTLVKGFETKFGNKYTECTIRQSENN